MWLNSAMQNQTRIFILYLMAEYEYANSLFNRFVRRRLWLTFLANRLSQRQMDPHFQAEYCEIDQLLQEFNPRFQATFKYSKGKWQNIWMVEFFLGLNGSNTPRFQDREQHPNGFVIRFWKSFHIFW